MEAGNHGKVVAIDIETGAYVLDENALTAVKRLRAQRPEGTRALVTLLPEEEAGFWVAASETSLSAVWDNAEDDVYAELLEK